MNMHKKTKNYIYTYMYNVAHGSVSLRYITEPFLQKNFVL